MDATSYARMASNEATHWWFAGRRAILGTLIGRLLHGRTTPRILEVGCGSGGNLSLLARFGRLDAVEHDAHARALAEARSGIAVRPATLPSDLPVADAAYDLVALLDVLEHVEEDRDALRAIGRKLTPEGRLLITVPAMPWLWSAHDVAHHHYRRYTRASLAAAIRESGMEVERIGYFNALLFPLAVAGRLVKRLRGDTRADDALPARPVNTVLQTVFSAERHVIGRISFWGGLSVYAVARPAPV